MLKVWAPIVSVVVLAIIGSLLLPESFDLSIQTPGKVLPNKEWQLIRNADGALTATLQDHANGTVDQYAINRFERGDAIQFALHPSVRDQRYITAGDTVGTISSSDINLRLTELQGELATRQASLKLFVAGEKPARIEEARQTILRAESRAEEHKNILARQRRLHDQQVISDEELEAAESLQAVYQADVAIAQAQLQARETGARQEQINLTNTEIEALNASIAALKDRLKYQTISSPISGYIARSFTPDTLLTVRDTTGFLVLMPIAWKNRMLIQTNAKVDIEVPEINVTVSGQLLDIGDTIHQINGEQVVPAIARIEGYHPEILTGMLINAAIHGGKVPLRDNLKYQLN